MNFKVNYLLYFFLEKRAVIGQYRRRPDPIFVPPHMANNKPVKHIGFRLSFAAAQATSVHPQATLIIPFILLIFIVITSLIIFVEEFLPNIVTRMSLTFIIKVVNICYDSIKRNRKALKWVFKKEDNKRRVGREDVASSTGAYDFIREERRSKTTKRNESYFSRVF